MQKNLKLIKAKVYMLAGSRCLIYYYALEKALSKSELKVKLNIREVAVLPR